MELKRNHYCFKNISPGTQNNNLCKLYLYHVHIMPDGALDTSITRPSTVMLLTLQKVRFLHSLTHWGRVRHICIGNLTIIGSDNGLSPGRRQAIIWTNAGMLLIGPLGTNFSEILIDIYTFSFKKMHLKMSSGKWQRFCLGLNVLRVNFNYLCHFIADRSILLSVLPRYWVSCWTHTKLGSCNPKAGAQDLKPLVYNWYKKLSLYRNEIISASYSDLLLFYKW